MHRRHHHHHHEHKYVPAAYAGGGGVPTLLIELIDVETGVALPTVIPPPPDANPQPQQQLVWPPLPVHDGLFAAWPYQEFRVRAVVRNIPAHWEAVFATVTVDGCELSYAIEARNTAGGAVDIVFRGFIERFAPETVYRAFCVDFARVDDDAAHRSGAAQRQQQQEQEQEQREAVHEATQDVLGTVTVKVFEGREVKVDPSDDASLWKTDVAPTRIKTKARDEDEQAHHRSDEKKSAGGVGAASGQSLNLGLRRHYDRKVVRVRSQCDVESTVRYMTPAMMRLRRMLPHGHPVARELERRGDEATREERQQREKRAAENHARAAANGGFEPEKDGDVTFVAQTPKGGTRVVCDLTGDVADGDADADGDAGDEGARPQWSKRRIVPPTSAAPSQSAGASNWRN